MDELITLPVKKKCKKQGDRFMFKNSDRLVFEGEHCWVFRGDRLLGKFLTSEDVKDSNNLGESHLNKDAGEKEAKPQKSYPPIPEGAKWITLQPTPEHPGARVLIMPHKDGSAHVIGGMGGKLNMLKLDSLKSPEEWEKNSKRLAEERRQWESERKAKQTDEARETEKKETENLKEFKQTQTHENALATIEALERAGLAHGLTDEHKLALQTPPDPGSEPEKIQEWEEQTKAAVQRVRAIHQAYERKLVTDHEARAQAKLADGDIELNRPIENRTHTAATADGQTISEIIALPNGQWMVRDDNHTQTFSTWRDAAKEHLGNVLEHEQENGGDRTQGAAFYSPAQWVKEPKEEDLPEGFGFSPDVALEVARLSMERKAADKGAREGEDAIKKKMGSELGIGAIVGRISEITDAQVLAKLEEDAKTLQDAATNNAFLDMVDDLGDAKTLDKHHKNGGWSAIAEIASEVFKHTPIARHLIDTLGHNEGAKVLAYMMRQNLTDAEYEAAKAAIAEHHAKTSVWHAKGTQKQVRKMLDRQKDLHEQMAILAELAEGDLDAQGQLEMDALSYEADSIHNAVQQLLGTQLGRLQASAALVAAMEANAKTLKFSGDQAEKLMAMVPGAETEDQEEGAPPSLFDAYEMNADEHFDVATGPDGKTRLTINESGMKQLAVGYNAEDREAYERAVAIKRGDFDEDMFVPEGFSHYEAIASFQPLDERDHFGIAPNVSDDMGDDEIKAEMQRYIGSVIANGVSALDARETIYNRAFPELFGIDKDSSLAIRMYAQVGEIINDMALIRDERGSRISYSRMIQGLDDLGDSERQRQWESGEGVDGTSLDTDVSVEAAHRTLASMPIARLALKDRSELSRKDLQQLQEYAIQHVWKAAIAQPEVSGGAFSEMNAIARDLSIPGKHGEEKNLQGQKYRYHAPSGEWLFERDFNAKERAAEEAKNISQGGLFDLGGFGSEPEPAPEPEEESPPSIDDGGTMSLFGGFGSDEGAIADPSQIEAPEPDPNSLGAPEKHETPWQQFSRLMGGSEKALAIAREHLQGQFNQRFAHSYEQLSGQSAPTKAKTHSHHKSLLAARMSPEDREAHLRRMRERDQSDAAKVRSRDAHGRLMAEDDDWYESYLATKGDPLQGGLGVEGAGLKKLESQTNYTSLGTRAQLDLNETLKSVLPNFEQISAPEVGIIPEVTWSGQHVTKQRTLKLLEAQKKIGLHAGAGSGKSSIMLGCFSHLHSQGKVKKMVVGVPSSIVGQFVGEAVTFLEGGKYNYAANLGWAREKRIEALKDPNMHVFVSTRESLTNDLLYLVDKHLGVDSEQYRERPESEQKDLLRKACKAEGIDPEDVLFCVDESQDIVTRKAVKASKRSLALKGFGHHSGYYIEASGNPAKNDASEFYSFLHAVAPDKFNDEAKFMAEYGSNDVAARRALQRAIAPYTIAFATKPMTKVSREQRGKGIQSETLRRREHQPQISASEMIAQKRQEILDDVQTISQWQSEHRKVLAEKHGDNYRPTPQDFNAAWKNEAVRASIDRLASENTWHKRSDEEKAGAIGAQVVAMGALKKTALFRLVHLTPYEDNPKMQWTVEHAIKQKEAGKPGIVFSSSSRACEMMKEEFEKRGLKVAYIHGGLDGSGKDAQRIMFQDAGEADILLATDAAKTGLNLTRGKYVVHYDTPVTQERYDQRSARAYRLKQSVDVDVFTPMLDMPEEKMALARMQRKAQVTGVYQERTEALDETGLARRIRESIKSQKSKKIPKAA